MLGSMQDWPLLVSRLIDHAERHHGATEVVSLRCEGDVHRSSWAGIAQRSRRCASALEQLGIRRGDRVATLAWNTHRHLEAWFGISGMGAVAHTVNPRLFRDQIIYIINHAEDRVLLFDLPFAPLVAEIAPQLTSVEQFIVLTDAEHLPTMPGLALLAYEDFLAQGSDGYDWPALDENMPAGLCYTSGTTGNPKGVLYSHRSNVLHTLFASAPDAFGLTARSVVMPIVPMYHANAWGLPYICAAQGAKFVLCGPNFDPETLHRTLIAEGATVSGAVPTVWLSMFQYLDRTGKDLGRLTDVMIGGSAVPRFMIERFRRDWNVQVRHIWGMTEMSPIGTAAMPNAASAGLDADAQTGLHCKQGRGIFGVDMRIVDDAGKDLPWDGVTFGRLMVKGPAVVQQYFKGDGGQVLDAQGWFDTGDVATIDPMGYMQITDRSKDVIKSGGEWISSIEIENIACGCPGVAEAAVIGIVHPRWDERPLLVIVRKPEATVSAADVLAHLEGRIAKWWMPDAVEFVEAIPHTATGKIQKLALREQFRDYRFASA